MEDLARVVRRNTFVLSLSMALNWAVIVLLASLTTPTIATLFGLPALAGAGFGLFLLAFAAGGLLTGRAMDAWGRRNGLQAAFLVGAAGAGVIYLGVGATSLPVSLLGLLLIGAGTGGANLARAAGADMYRPERRPRGIAFVLFGAAFGAIGAPIVFAPLLPAEHQVSAASLAAPWSMAVALMLAGAALLLAIRTDPRDIAERLRADAAAARGEELGAAAPARSLRELFRLPMVPLALLAALVAQGVMTTIMALAGLVLHQHGHRLDAVTLTVSIHFVGMFGLVLFVGRLVERVGRFRSVLVGLLALAGGVVLLLPGAALLNFIPGMFLVGVGWNIAFVASTAILADAARPAERGRLLGFSDFVALCGSAAMSVVGGLVLIVFGLTYLLVGGIALVLVPALLIGLNRTRLEGVAQPG